MAFCTHENRDVWRSGVTCEPEDESRANSRNAKYIKDAPANGKCPQHEQFNFAGLTEYEIGKYEGAEQVNGMAVTPKFSWKFVNWLVLREHK
jgi:hypothetical protein